MADAQSLIRRIRKQDRSQCDACLCSEMDAWIRQLEESEALEALRDNFVIKAMLERYANAVADMDYSLTSKRSRDLPDSERDNLLDRKKLYLDFIATFDAGARVAEIERAVAENL